MHIQPVESSVLFLEVTAPHNICLSSAESIAFELAFKILNY